MTYKIAHISDLHISRSIQECLAEKNEDMKTKIKDMEKLHSEIEEIDKNISRTIASIPEIPPPPPPPLLPVRIVPDSGGRPRLLHTMEKTSSYLLKKHREEYDDWKTIAEKLGVVVGELEHIKEELKEQKHKKTSEYDAARKRSDAIKRDATSRLSEFVKSCYKASFPRDLYAPLLRSIRDHDVNHVIVTGDITNFSQKLEYQDFLTAFSELIGAERLSVIPGNHDTQLYELSIPFEGGLGSLIPKRYPDVIKIDKVLNFPYVKELEESICLIGLDSSIHAGDDSAKKFYGNVVGRIDVDQFRELERILSDRNLAKRTIVVAIHHNLISIGSSEIPKDTDDIQKIVASLRMKGSEKLNLLMRKYGVKIVLNGHVHFPFHSPEGKNNPEILTAGAIGRRYNNAYKYNIVSIKDNNVTSSEVAFDI